MLFDIKKIDKKALRAFLICLSAFDIIKLININKTKERNVHR